ncbi:MAG: AbrB/MazE/SpoVT family DNA-binding domain-containing protein [Candidatus Bathyarchaeia archaeon]
MAEEIITTVKAYLTDTSKVVVIPKELRKKLGEENTELFIVKLDDRQRIILEPIRKNFPLNIKKPRGRNAE